MRRDAGFTLVELLVNMAVAAVLLGIGMPAFGSLVQESRLTTTTNRLVAALHLARSEAVRHNARVTLCNSGDGSYCAEGGGWDQGWIVFLDTDATGARSDDDPLIAVGDAAVDGISISGNTPVQRYVSYIGLGATRRASGALQMGTITLCAGEAGRQIVISRTGRPRVQQGGCA